MAQTKFGSFVEAWANIAVGFGINFGANLVLLPLLWDPSYPTHSAFAIGLCFTAISLIRQFLLRRVFNRAKFGNKPDPVGMEHAP